MSAYLYSKLWIESPKDNEKTPPSWANKKVMIPVFMILFMIVLAVLKSPEFEIKKERLTIEDNWNFYIEVNDRSSPAIVCRGKNEFEIYWNEGSNIQQSEVKLGEKGPEPWPPVRGVLVSQISAVKPFAQIVGGQTVVCGTSADPPNGIFLIEVIGNEKKMHWIIDQLAEEARCAMLITTSSTSHWLVWTARKQNSSQFEIVFNEIKVPLSDLGERTTLSKRDTLKVPSLDEKCSFRFIRLFPLTNEGDKGKVFFTCETGLDTPENEDDEKKLYCGILDFKDKKIDPLQEITIRFPESEFSVASVKDNEWILCYSTLEGASGGNSYYEISVIRCSNKNTWELSPVNLFKESKYSSDEFINTEPYLSVNNSEKELWIAWSSSPLDDPNKYMIRIARVSSLGGIFERIFVLFTHNPKGILIIVLVFILSVLLVQITSPRATFRKKIKEIVFLASAFFSIAMAFFFFLFLQ